MVTEPGAGNVGINTTSPLDPLHVVGVVRATGGVRFGDGTLQTTAGGNGDITGVTAGTGLTGGGTTGDVTVSLITSCAVNQLLRWNGAAWVCSTETTGSGDITDVVAGAGLVGGGASGSVTLSANFPAAGGDAGSASTVSRSDHLHDGRYLQTNNPAAAQSVISSSLNLTGTTTITGVTTVTGNATFQQRLTTRTQLEAATTNSATSGSGVNSPPLMFGYSVFEAPPANTSRAQEFRLQAEPVGNSTVTPAGRMALLWGPSGAATPTGLFISNTGIITFAAGQTFPGGGGTITGVTAGTGLTGGGTSGTVALSLLTSCSTNQILKWNGTAWVCSADVDTNSGGDLTDVLAGTGVVVTNGAGPSPAVAIDTTIVPRLNFGNTFTTGQMVNVAGAGTLLDLQSSGASRFMVSDSLVRLPAIGTAVPASGADSIPIEMVALSLHSVGPVTVSQRFAWQAQDVNNNTTSPSGRLALRYATDSNPLGDTGFSINPDGSFRAASFFDVFSGINVGLRTDCTGGQIMKFLSGSWQCSTDLSGGAGSGISDLTAGIGLLASPTNPLTAGGGSLSIDPAVVARLTTSNTFAGSVTATSLSTSGTVFGAFGNFSTAANGNAVLFADNAGTANAVGITGRTATTNFGSGVFGEAYGTTGISYGVRGLTASTGLMAAGVRGEVSSITGQTYGVLGMNASTTSDAAGVRGDASGTSGSVIGVSGVASTSPGGIGVRGQGNAAGVLGLSGGASGPGGLFQNTSTGPILRGLNNVGTTVFNVAGSGATTATGFFDSSTGRIAGLLGTCTAGQIMKVNPGGTDWQCDADTGGGGSGDLTDVLGGTGITVTNGAGPQPSVAIDIGVVPRLNAANTFTAGMTGTTGNFSGSTTTAGTAIMRVAQSGLGSLASQDGPAAVWGEATGGGSGRVIGVKGTAVSFGGVGVHAESTDAASGAGLFARGATAVRGDAIGDGFGVIGQTAGGIGVYGTASTATGTGGRFDNTNLSGDLIQGRSGGLANLVFRVDANGNVRTNFFRDLATGKNAGLLPTCTAGQIMKVNPGGTDWQCDADNGGAGSGDVTDVLGGTGITVTNGAGPQPSVALNTGFTDGRYLMLTGGSLSGSLSGTSGLFVSAVAGAVLSSNNTSSAVNATAVMGEATGGSGANFGVWGRNSSITNNAAGVRGEATGSSGTTFGVLGLNASSTGIAIQGDASSATGATIGVKGLSQSSTDDSKGLEGRASATGGRTVGVQGISFSPLGKGVEGLAAAGTGATIGVRGYVQSTDAGASAGVFNTEFNAARVLSGVQGGGAGGPATEVFRVNGVGRVYADSFFDIFTNVEISLRTDCASGQIMKWNGTAWQCDTDNGGSSGGDLTDVLAGTGITVTNGAGPQPSVALDTVFTDGRYAETATGNTFTGNQTFNAAAGGSIAFNPGTGGTFSVSAPAGTITFSPGATNFSSGTVNMNGNLTGAGATFTLIGGTTLAANQNSTSALAVYGIDAANSATGASSAAPAVAVRGRATSGVGTSNHIGVQGTASGGGVGVDGIGGSIGVRGATSTTSSIGVHGRSPATGVLGENDLLTGSGTAGVRGIMNVKSDGGGIGVRGEATHSSGGIGVFGVAGSSSTTAAGGTFQNTNASGKLIRGLNSAGAEVFSVSNSGSVTISGTFQGAYSGDGAALLNVNAAMLGGFSASLYPRTDLMNAFGLQQNFNGGILVNNGANFMNFGDALAATSSSTIGVTGSGVEFGVRGNTSGTPAFCGSLFLTGGAGVCGNHSGGGVGVAGFGSGAGMFGSTDGFGGAGVVGEATDNTSVNYGVFGTSSSPEGFGLGTDVNARIQGMMRMGSETGTSEGPQINGPQGPYRGLVMRRIFSTDSSASSVVARAAFMELQRDGTDAGWRINVTTPPSQGEYVITCTAVDRSGFNRNRTIQFSSGGIFTVWSNSDDITFMHCLFGDPANEGHTTEVSLHRFSGPGFSQGQKKWVGHLTSTFNQ
jgi:hypothetical protein